MVSHWAAGHVKWYDTQVKTLSDYTFVVAPDNHAYLAYAPAIKGCYALGDTQDAARAELEMVFEMIAEEYIEEGRELPPDVPGLVVASALG
jgi:predicted RNase H-like HicB family nuclease